MKQSLPTYPKRSHVLWLVLLLTVLLPAVSGWLGRPDGSLYAQCNTSAPVVLAKWDFNSSTVICNGAASRVKTSNTTPQFESNQYNYCPQTNSGCGQALLGSPGHLNSTAFANGLCLSNFYNAAYIKSVGGATFQPKSTVFDPEGKANLTITYKAPAGKAGCLSDLKLLILQKQFNGTTVNFEKQGVAIKRNGVLVYNQTKPILAANVNATPMQFAFSGADFCWDGSAEVTFTIIFGLVNQFGSPGFPGSEATTGYDDICLNGTCGGSPSPTAAISPATCGAASANSDGKITLTNFGVTDHYAISMAGSYTGTQTYANTSAIPVGGVVTGSLPNPASPQAYTVRVFTAAGCTTDLTVTLNPTVCSSGCTPPTGTASFTAATCTGTSPNNNARIAITGVTGGNRVGISLGTPYSGLPFASAQPLTGGAYSFTALPNPNGNQAYTVRVFNAGDACFKDFPVTMTETACGCKKIAVQIKKSDQADPDSSPNNNATGEDDLTTYEVCKGTQFIDLKLTKTVSPTGGTTCPTNTPFVWTLTLTNEGTMTATNIQVADNMPDGLLETGSTATAGEYGRTTGWLIPSLAANASATLTITTKALRAGTFQNCAWVNGAFPLNDIDSSPLNDNTANEDDDDCATITVTGPQTPDLAKEFSPAGAKPNTPIRLTIKLTNNETLPITLTAPLVDNLPASPAQMTVAPTPNLTTTLPGVLVTAGGTSVTIPIGTVLVPGLNLVQVDVIAPSAGDYCNTLAAGALKTTSCDNLSPATACAVVRNPYVMGPLIKKSFAPEIVAVGQSSTLTITVDNRNTTGITLLQNFIDELPAGLVVAGAVTGTCSGVSTFTTTNEVGLLGGSVLAPGICTIRVPVKSTTAGNYCNQIPENALIGTVSNGTLTVMTSNEDIATACLTVTTTPCTTLDITTVTPASLTVAPGGTVSLTVNGTGLTPSTLYTWSGNGSVNPQGVTTTYTAPTTTGTYTLTVAATNRLTGYGGCADAETRMLFVQNTQTPVDIGVTKVRTSAQQSTVGGSVTFQVVAKNNSSTPATNVVVSDLPAAADFSGVTGVASQGNYTAGTGAWNVGTLSAGASATLTVSATVIREGISYNTASLSGVTEGDNNPNNDTDRACVTVPVALTGNQTYTATVPAQYSAVQWFKDGVPAVTGNIYVINATGVYTFTASNGGCAGGTCCPLLVTKTVCSLTASLSTTCNTIRPTIAGGTGLYTYSYTGPTMAVTVVTKTGTHPDFNIGFPQGYAIDGTQGKELTLIRGVRYSFVVNAPGHPFMFTGSAAGGPANGGQVITAGVTNSGATSGTVTFVPSAATPNLIYYQCGNHENMGWKINVIDQQPNGVLTAVMNGAYSLTVSDETSCSATATTTVNTPALPRPAASTICEGGGLTFGISVNAGDAAYWTTPTNTTVSSGTVTISNALLTDAGNYTLTYTSAAGCVATTTKTVTVNAKPTLALANSGCVSGNQSYTVLVSTNAASLSTNGASVGVTINGNLITAPIAVTSFTVTALSATGCVTMLPVMAPACTTVCTPPNPGPDQQLCEGTISTTLVSPGAGQQWFLLQQVSGSNPVVNQAGSPVTVTGLTVPGVYKFALVSTSVSNCSAVVTVTVNPKTILPVYPSATLCEGQGLSFGVNIPAGASAYWTTPINTTISSGTVTISNATTANAGTYMLIYTNATGCVSTTTKSLTVNANPTLTLVSSGCVSGNQSYTALVSTNATSLTTNAGPAGVVQNGNLFSAPVSVAGFVISASSAAGCVMTLPVTAPACTTACTPPNPGPDQTLCEGTISTTLATPGAGEQWSVAQQVTGSNPMINQSGNPVTVSGLTVPGVYKFRLVSTSVSNCSAVVTVTVNPKTTLPVYASSTICESSNFTFSISPAAGASAYWTTPTNTTVGSSTVTISNATTANAGVYTLYYTNATGCISTTTKTIAVSPLPSLSLVAGSSACMTGNLSYTALLSTNAASVTTNAAAFGVTINGNLITAPSTVALFTVTATSTAGCFRQIDITRPTCPTVCSLTATASASSSTLTQGQAVTLTAQVSPAGSYTYAWTGSGTITPTNTAAVSASGLATGVNTFTVTVTSAPGCFTAATVSVTVLSPVVAVTVTPGVCQPATNQYSISGVLSLTNAIAGTAIIADGTSTTTVAVTAGVTSVPYTFTGLTSGTGSHTVTVNYAGQTARIMYLAPLSCTVVLPASLGDFVWYDTNGNGQQDTGEPGVPGVTVKLYNPVSGTVTPIASLTTNSQGKYLFTNLAPGVYCVIFDKTTLPAGYTLTTANSGTDATDSDADPATGKTTNYTLAAGDQNLTVDAGLVPPVGSIGNYVWKDNNNNGLQDNNEPGVPGITVQLFTVVNGTISSTPLAVTVTSASGLYSFGNLSSGQYQVKFTVPASLTDGCQITTKPNAGNDDTKDSDINPVTGLSPVITIDATQLETSIARNNPTIDLGLERRIYDPIGFIYCYRDNTILKGGTIRVTGPGSITIIKDGSDGAYQFFTNGTPGSYTMTYSHPNGYSIATAQRPVSFSLIDPTGLEGTPVDKDGVLNGWIQLGSLADSQTSPTRLLDGSAAANPYYLVFRVAPGDPYISENNLPVDCTPPATPKLSLTKSVNKSRAAIGDVLTYTVVVTNAGSVSATNVIVRDSLDALLQYVPNSATVSNGTFTAGIPTSVWSGLTVPASGTATLVYRAVILAQGEGIRYNTATIPGDTAQVCTSVPFRVCADQPYAIALSAPAGHTGYQWLRNGTPIPQATQRSYTAMVAGDYSVQVDGNGSCASGSCCPFIIEDITLPNALTVVTTTPGCQGTVAQADGRLTLTGLDAGTYTYRYSTGAVFNAVAASVVTTVPANGILATTLTGGQNYTVRVFNAAGCYRDLPVFLPAAVCACPPTTACLPISMRKIVRTR